MANENYNAETSQSQTARILKYLLEGNKITPLEALYKFGTMRLGARVADIGKLIGHPLSRRRVKVTNAEGKEVYVMEYSL